MWKNGFFKVALFAAALLGSSAYAYESYVELKPGYFRFEEEALRDIYGDGGFTIQGEVGTYCRCFGLAFNFSYFGQDGTALNSDFNTHLSLYGASLLFKWKWDMGTCFTPYIGGGPKFFHLNIHDDCPFVSQGVRKSDVGGVITVGGYLTFKACGCCWFLDPFFDYQFVKFDFKDNQSSFRYDANLNGFSVGVGIGTVF